MNAYVYIEIRSRSVYVYPCRARKPGTPKVCSDSFDPTILLFSLVRKGVGKRVGGKGKCIGEQSHRAFSTACLIVV